ncbi:MAG: phosphoribosylformylglycinamidine synthase [Clostridia bacterium]|nr:phosphoribosylformylglycinamidine synthase [Clostridia bacterium]
MVYRIFVEKKPHLAHEADTLLSDARSFLGIQALERVRIINRYDVEDIDETLFRAVLPTVFSEPQLDTVSEEIDLTGAHVFAAEYLPGQFDQRADSAAQCIQLISRSVRPTVRTARVYALYGDLTSEDLAKIRRYVINPVESQEASMEKPDTLKMRFAIPTPVETLSGFLALDREGLADFVRRYGLAMDTDDIAFCQDYFRTEQRDPTITEIRMIDTYWSDHCRHTTFLTHIDTVHFDDPLLEKAWADYLQARQDLGTEKPICLMDLGTIAARHLRKTGGLAKLDESEEINACTVKITVNIDGKDEPWLLLFKNETHNHPTEIEPFGGAATCIGGAIRDPLSGRSYVYGAMRVTGAADPRTPAEKTIPGKLPQRRIVTGAAAGYSSYGNQIGLATGIVDELYHPGYAAKRLEIGAVIAAAPQSHVRREVPAPGDQVILLGGSTGRDGCGGATGSSKSHTLSSLTECGAEVQKGNAPEERKLQRLFRNPNATRLIKRCNDFGAGGVSVAIGELADGLHINLNLVPRKYEGLDGTELAISESQERMAVVVSPEDTDAFLELAADENLQACVVAPVTVEKRLVMEWNGKEIVNIARTFLNSNGAEKHISVLAQSTAPWENHPEGSFTDLYLALAPSLSACSRRGLAERFDSTIGAGTVLMPFGGKNQLTPIQAMVQKISLEHGHTDDVSLMAWGFNPEITEKSPYHGAYLAVVESVCKLIATGAAFEDVYLTFQEYFLHPGKDEKRWSQPLTALLGAFEAQKDLGIAAIGGKDSMSGTFESLDVPPTLVSFAVTTGKTSEIVSPELKGAGHVVTLIDCKLTPDGLPEAASLLETFALVHSLILQGKALSVYTPGNGGIAEAILKMALGNTVGFTFDPAFDPAALFAYRYGSFLVESEEELGIGRVLGRTTDTPVLAREGEVLPLRQLQGLWEGTLESVYPCNIAQADSSTETLTYTATSWPTPAVVTRTPTFLIPAFPGTNCEMDSARAVEDAGGKAEILVIRNLTASDVQKSVERMQSALRRAQVLFIPGGFSGGDEPDGSGKFITAFLRNAALTEEVEKLLYERDGLALGICNGFQALIKLGLVPYGHITEPDEHAPTLTFNTISRHQSRLVRTRVSSNLSPWLMGVQPGDVFTVPISHGEGRFLADPALVRELAARGQIATQYVDFEASATSDIRFNPNDSVYAVEGITSPDGRVLGKMGHSERVGAGLYKNVPGEYDMKLFASAIRYLGGN